MLDLKSALVPREMFSIHMLRADRPLLMERFSRICFSVRQTFGSTIRSHATRSTKLISPTLVILVIRFSCVMLKLMMK